MPDSEIATLRSAVAELNDSTGELSDRLAEMNGFLVALSKELSVIQKKLPEFVPRSRFRLIVTLLVVAGLLVLSLVLWLRGERRREIQAERRAGAARGYGNCTNGNRILDGVDRGYTVVGDVLRSGATTPEARERVDNILAALRSGLQRTDCSDILADLSPRDAERVKDEAVRTLPTLPLPPPPQPPTITR